MNADLEAAIDEGRRRMRQFEERTSNQLESFDQEVEHKHYQLGHKFSSLTEDLKPVSAPLWGVILETESGHRIYKQNVPFDVVLKSPRRCPTIQNRAQLRAFESTINSQPPSSSSLFESQLSPTNSTSNQKEPLHYEDEWNLTREIEPFQLSIESKTIMEGRKWGVNKYLQDDSYVSNAPYGILMRKPPKAEPRNSNDVDTSKVSSYWRRKYNIKDN